MALQQTELINIGSRDRQIRAILGMALLAIGVAVAALFAVGGVAAWWRALVFIPFGLGLTLVLESRRGVCPLLASKGLRNLEGVFPTSGVAIPDRSLADRIRQQGRAVLLQSLVGAIVLTAIYLLIPV